MMNYATLRKIALTVKITLAMTWAGTAFAAAVAVQSTKDDLGSLDPLLVILSVVICNLAGGTALALRLTKLFMDRDEGIPLVRPWLFAWANMGGSWMAGMCAFFLGKLRDFGTWEMLLGVLVFSFIGSKAVEMLADKMLGGAPLAGNGKPKGDKDD